MGARRMYAGGIASPGLRAGAFRCKHGSGTVQLRKHRVSGGPRMTDEQVNRIVDHLCQQLHVAIRLKGAQSEVFPPNIKDLGFDPASLRTAADRIQVGGRHTSPRNGGRRRTAVVLNERAGRSPAPQRSSFRTKAFEISRCIRFRASFDCGLTFPSGPAR
jgi:hypothetical protein